MSQMTGGKEMKKILITLCIAAIVINTGLFVYIEFNDLNTDNLQKIDAENDITENEITVDPETFTVTVPEQNIDDRTKYDYDIFAEIYTENETAYERYTLTADGVIIINVLSATVEDGFKQYHECL